MLFLKFSYEVMFKSFKANFTDSLVIFRIDDYILNLILIFGKSYLFFDFDFF